MAQVAEFQSWRRFRRALLRGERRAFDEMLEEARFHTSASSMAVRTSVFEGVFMAILLHHYEELDGLLAGTDGGDGMSLFDEEVPEEVRSWEGFANALRSEERALFEKMLASSLENGPAMRARTSPFPVEGLFMSILFSQHKLIEELRSRATLRDEAQG